MTLVRGRKAQQSKGKHRKEVSRAPTRSAPTRCGWGIKRKFKGRRGVEKKLKLRTRPLAIGELGGGVSWEAWEDLEKPGPEKKIQSYYTKKVTVRPRRDGFPI